MALGFDGVEVGEGGDGVEEMRSEEVSTGVFLKG